MPDILIPVVKLKRTKILKGKLEAELLGALKTLKGGLGLIFKEKNIKEKHVTPALNCCFPFASNIFFC